ncbi:MAG: DNA-3-methyladenine glycosylase [Acidiferrobacteraceae bacterium]|jgi:DNA-3-methyladenine glycosylase II|nr:DNA-3-methyladenine glycosylase [Acidiferrobacteraceae bacterium]|tara:strand:+ start:54854 stop:55486 length:633 start_codon:yes stop_codon:yes gene_type:complete
MNRLSFMTFDPITASAHLRRVDPGLGRCINKVGQCQLTVRRNRSVFEYLVRSIVYQQLTGKSALAIYIRLLDNFPHHRVRPEQLLSLNLQQFQSAGLSKSKIKALQHLAKASLGGGVPSISKLHCMHDDEIIEKLSSIWGIGRWTVEMLLIFHLGRPDVLPVNDLGILRGYQKLRGYSELPPSDRLMRAGKRWRPYRTVASWYLWRSLDI